MFELKELDGYIRYMLRNVSPHLKDDCYQAACLGILEAAKKYDPSKSKFKTYIKNHKGYIEHEILKEVAKLSFPFSISKSSLIDLIKFKRGELEDISDRRKRSLQRLSEVKQTKYDQTIEQN